MRRKGPWYGCRFVPYAVRAATHLLVIDYAEVFRRQVELIIGDFGARVGRAWS